MSDIHLLRGRYGMPAVTWRERAYVLGGETKEGRLGDVEAINGRTGNIAALPIKLLPRRYHTAQVIGDAVYIAGGYTDAGYPNDLERLDLKTGKVEKLRPMPTPRSACASVVVDGRLWVVGGSSDGGYIDALELYDPRTDKWEAGPPLPTARECAAVYHNGLIHVVGGYAGVAGTRLWDAYTVGSARWFRMPALPLPMSAHHMTTVGNKLYIFGDYTALGRVSACDLLRGVWYTPRLPETYRPRRHNAVTAIGYTVFVIGGCISGSGSYLDTVQAFQLPG